MKNLLLSLFALVIFAAAATPVEAQQRKRQKPKEDRIVDDFQKSFKRQYGAAGCGLGSMVLGTKPGFMQVFAATTNGTFGSQTFGITTGTSNCVGPNGENAMMKMDIFLEHNKNQVAADLSRGQGETIGTMAYILGCSDAGNLGSALKNNYSRVYTSEEVSVNEITDNVITVIINNQELSNDCKNVSDIG